MPAVATNIFQGEYARLVHTDVGLCEWYLRNMWKGLNYTGDKEVYLAKKRMFIRMWVHEAHKYQNTRQIIIIN